MRLAAGKTALLKSKIHTMIKIHDSKDHQYYFTLCGKNGHVILTSETYKTKRNRDKGIVAFIKAATIAIKELAVTH